MGYVILVVFFIDDNDKEIGLFSPKYKNGYILKEMLKDMKCSISQYLYVKSYLKNSMKNITIGEDYNLFMQILNKVEAVSIKDHLIKYRVHKNSITKKAKE